MCSASPSSKRVCSVHYNSARSISRGKVRCYVRLVKVLNATRCAAEAETLGKLRRAFEAVYLLEQILFEGTEVQWC